MAESANNNRGGPTDEELVAILVERGVPEQVAIERVARLQQNPPAVIGRKGEPIAIEQSEIDVWLSLGSFG